LARAGAGCAFAVQSTGTDIASAATIVIASEATRSSHQRLIPHLDGVGRAAAP